MTAPGAPSEMPPVSQPVVQDLTRAAIFLVVTINPGAASRTAVRAFCGDLPALVRAVGFRDIEGNLSCVMGIGSDAWDRLFGRPRPAELHPFREIRAGSRHAIATSGDLMFHIRAKRMDLCFELATQIMTRLGGAVSPVDEVHGFRFFDERDLLGFVDGTENPTGQAAIDAAYVGAEDAVFAGGSYVIVQKYLHDLAGWNTLSTEAQERIIGRSKLSDIELDAAEKEFGTYFIGYARSPRTIEQMLQNMFVGRPVGNYDRLLDFSVAKTGNLFFVPSATFLENVADGDTAAEFSDQPAAPLPKPALKREGSLGIGSLKGDPAS